MRVGRSDSPGWEPGLERGIRRGKIFIRGGVGARGESGGVIMYGPSRSLKDIKKAIQLGKE